MEGQYARMMESSPSCSSPATETTPLIDHQSHSTMSGKDIGISQQTLVSNAGENGTSGRKVTQYIAGLAATLGALAAGMVLGWTASSGINGTELSAQYKIPMTKEEFSWIGSIFNLGAATICIPIGILADIVGRKKSMLMLVVPFEIGWALIIWSDSVMMFNFGRYILGVSGGAFCVTAPMYTGEIAENSIRGSLGSYFQLMLTVGILLAYILGSTLSIFYLSLISGAIPLIFFAAFIFMPETPMYYLKKGNVDAARESYRWLRGSHYNIEPELEEQKQALAEAERNQISFMVAIRSRAALKGLFIGFGLMFFQQLSGVNAIIFYVSSIFPSSGDPADTNRSTIIVGAMQVIAVFVSTLIVDRLGRRLLLLVSSTVMCITTLILGIYFSLTNVQGIEWIPLVAVCAFIILFSLGFGPIPWMMMGEIFSPQIKGIAGSSACLFNWLMAFVVTKFYSTIEGSFGKNVTFFIFSIICGVAIIFVFLVVPETKGKSLDQIQMELGGNSPARQSNGNQTNKP